MAPDGLLLELLHRWEEGRRRGKAPSPEELCASCPHLLGEVKQAMAKLGQFDVAFGAAPAEARPPEVGNTAVPAEDESVAQPRPAADTNLLFGVLALEMDFISRDALIGAMQAWVFDKNKPLGKILLEQKALAEDEHALLEALVQKHLRRHGNDPERSLAAVRAVPSLRGELERLGDPDLNASLAHASAGRRAGKSPPPAPEGSVGTLTSSGLRFRVIRPHAKGNLGEVFVALDEELRREVALKEIQERHADHPDHRARFVREAEITGGLEHPGIVPVYGLGQYPDGRPFYAMRLIQGETLKDAIDRYHRTTTPGRDPGERSLDLRKLLDRFLMVCNAVAYAHSRGVLHRDLKPGNIMLGSFGETLVVDWGLAKRVGRAEEAPVPEAPPPREAEGCDLTRIGQTLGTPAYMSPEQAAGHWDRVGPASDVYSLGATLYCLLTGRAPFAEKNLFTLLQRVQQGDFPRPRDINPQVPAPLEAICLKAMAPAPEGRYGTAQALAGDLERWLADADRQRVRALEQEAQVRRSLYFSRISLADRAWQDGQIWKMHQLLQEQLPRDPAEGDFRGFEWHYLWHLCHGSLLTLQGHTAAVRDVAFSPDGRRLASASDDRTVTVWEAATGRKLFTLYGHSGGVTSVVFSPDGRRLASGSLDRTVMVWDAAAGRELDTLRGHTSGVTAVAFSPDGQRLASGSLDRSIKVWDAAAGRVAVTLRGHEVTKVAFSPDGQRLASAGGREVEQAHKPFRGEVRIWDLTSGLEITRITLANLVSAVAFSPDGQRLAGATSMWNAEEGAAISGHAWAVKVWDTATGKKITSLAGGAGQIPSVVFSPDGKHVAAASGHQVTVWDSTTNLPTLSHKGHTGVVLSVAYSPDGTRLASASQDGTVKVWDTNLEQGSLPLRGHLQSVLGVAYSPDGTRLASASYDRTVKLWDPVTGRESHTLRGHRWSVLAVAFSPDGKRLASASFDKTVKVWDAATGQELLSLKGHDSAVYCVSFTPDGKHLASGAKDGAVKVWDAATGGEVLAFPGQPGTAWCLAYSPDGRLLAGSDDEVVRVWDAATGRELRALRGHAQSVLGLAFSPDGRRLASGSLDGTTKVWDAAAGRELAALHGHTGEVTAVAFSPDGGRLATSSQDGTVKVWDAATGQEALTLKGHLGGVWCVAFSPRGDYLASASKDRTVRLWDARPVEAPKNGGARVEGSEFVAG